MPLRDRFRAPLRDELDFESFHSAWANTMVRHLNERLLPPRYRSQPEVHLGTQVEIDVSPAVWAPAQASQCLEVEFPVQDVFEIRVVDRRRGTRLVAAVELVSPRNKDRPESRRVFAVKCASYLERSCLWSWWTR
jgi:hypothetical protein